MIKLNHAFTASTLALLIAAGGSVPAAAQEQKLPMEPQTPFHATQMQPASPQMWDPIMVEAGMRSLGYDEVSEVRQEGGQWLANARRDGDQYELTFDPVTGDIRDNTGATVGKAPRMVQNQAGGTTPDGSSTSADETSSASGTTSGATSADMTASQERVITALEAAGLTNVNILNTAYLVQAQTPQGEMVTMVVDTARLAAADAGAAGAAASGAASSGTTDSGSGAADDAESSQTGNGNPNGSGSETGSSSDDAASGRNSSNQ